MKSAKVAGPSGVVACCKNHLRSLSPSSLRNFETRELETDLQQDKNSYFVFLDVKMSLMERIGYCRIRKMVT